MNFKYGYSWFMVLLLTCTVSLVKSQITVTKMYYFPENVCVYARYDEQDIMVDEPSTIIYTKKHFKKKLHKSFASFIEKLDTLSSEPLGEYFPDIIVEYKEKEKTKYITFSGRGWIYFYYPPDKRDTVRYIDKGMNAYLILEENIPSFYKERKGTIWSVLDKKREENKKSEIEKGNKK